jgi:uncharacterized protein YecE (DUF72 family)
MASFGRRFEFSVKCHHALTHSIKPRPTEDAFGLLELMLTYCRILGSKLLVLQSPVFAKLDQDFQAKLLYFISKFLLRHPFFLELPQLLWECAFPLPAYPVAFVN